MISQEQSYQILYVPHVSEKASIAFNTNNKLIFRVAVKATKLEIKVAFKKLFSVDVKDINTVLVKGKVKKKGKYNIYKKNWKKAYITFQKGQNLDFIKNI
ncbi:50S ribosomal protein L23 [Buchnera aphidicola]|uniref:Large ribosomal subunit protein uL23 n=1 Tax=Buchnera aphidicola (Stegophylla sp.) TaxID=2315800 RepID=A0A4D6YKI6_9GAMM|nr:50S ribosomal protein L23 [Buchnera aphidicola (Stegophylla sp.)]QCI26484.1 50S ribosomal protein L23 [Buchnera aphidicola (Stegophylla sp.)]